MNTKPATPTIKQIQVMLPHLASVLRQYWFSPDELRKQAIPVLASADTDPPVEVLVSGETDNLTIYARYQNEIIVFTPFEEVTHNVVLQDKYPNGFEPTHPHYHIVPVTQRLLTRLQLPRVLLVNPCVLENFPVPRLCLSISVLASYLRRLQTADVHLVDMQMGTTIEDITAATRRLKPAIFGISISYGQKHLAIDILDRVKDLHSAVHPVFVLGNIIPASFPKEFLQRYPEAIIANNEGEYALAGIVEYVQGHRALEDIPGITYRRADGASLTVINTTIGQDRMVATNKIPVRPEDLLLPAFDTIPDLARHRGAMTLELSRGCQWNACKLCPREHKASHWKTMCANEALRQLSKYRDICDRFNITKHVYLADEEFVGISDGGQETERITTIAEGMIAQDLQLKFDAAARADQAYNHRESKQWHVQRMAMWAAASRAGLDRLFVGVESGAPAQLQRLGKGLTPEDSVMAIRILSALGIPLRFGFIMFDHLMIGLDEIKQNMAFLQRTDAILRRVDLEQYPAELLFDLLHDDEFVQQQAAGIPIYAGVSYMLASLEVLINSPYRKLVESAERKYNKALIIGPNTPDTNMGRLRVRFLDDNVGALSVCCQEWIDRHFGLAYTVKSLHKVAASAEKHHLMQWMIAYRRTSMELVQAMVAALDHNAQTGTASPTSTWRPEPDALGIPPKDVLHQCMTYHDDRVRAKNATLQRHLQDATIADTPDRQLAAVLSRWEQTRGQWRLINDFAA